MSKLRYAVFGVLLASGLSGCYYSVQTYDRNGTILAECDSSVRLFGAIPFAGLMNGCNGSANPKDQVDGPLPALQAPQRQPISDTHMTSCPNGERLTDGFCRPFIPGHE